MVGDAWKRKFVWNLRENEGNHGIIGSTCPEVPQLHLFLHLFVFPLTINVREHREPLKMRNATLFEFSGEKKGKSNLF